MRDHVGTLKHAVPYIRLYKGKIFIVKIGGNVLSDRDVTEALAADISLLHQLGIGIVLVHGGGPQANELSLKLGIEPEIIDGRRVTSAEALEVAKMTFGGKLNLDLLSALRREGTPGVGLSGIDAGLIRAVRRPVQEIPEADRQPGKPSQVDYGFVGDVVSVNVEFLRYLLRGAYVPVICSLACTDQGQILNINADTVAERVAAALEAEKLVFLTDQPGVLLDGDDPASVIPYADIEETERLVMDGRIRGGMLPKVEACMRALRSGVRRTHVIDGQRADSLLLEVFTNEGCGTMIVGRKEMTSYVSEEVSSAADDGGTEAGDGSS